MAIFPILMLAMVLNFIAMAIASAERISSLLETEPALKEAADSVSPSEIMGEIELKDVCFHYGSGECAIEDISLKIKPGEKLGIIGTTGSGKSTLVNLLPRYYDASSGTVSVDGIDVKMMSFESLRSNVVAALQETVLFSGTIRDNIRFGRPDATDEHQDAEQHLCGRVQVCAGLSLRPSGVAVAGLSLLHAAMSRRGPSSRLAACAGVAIE